MKITVPYTFELNKKEIKTLRDVAGGDYSLDMAIIEKFRALNLIHSVNTHVNWNEYIYKTTKEGALILSRLDVYDGSLLEPDHLRFAYYNYKPLIHKN